MSDNKTVQSRSGLSMENVDPGQITLINTVGRSKRTDLETQKAEKVAQSISRKKRFAPLIFLLFLIVGVSGLVLIFERTDNKPIEHYLSLWMLVSGVSIVAALLVFTKKKESKRKNDYAQGKIHPSG